MQWVTTKLSAECMPISRKSTLDIFTKRAENSSYFPEKTEEKSGDTFSVWIVMNTEKKKMMYTQLPGAVVTCLQLIMIRHLHKRIHNVCSSAA